MSLLEKALHTIIWGSKTRREHLFVLPWKNNFDNSQISAIVFDDPYHILITSTAKLVDIIFTFSKQLY